MDDNRNKRLLCAVVMAAGAASMAVHLNSLSTACMTIFDRTDQREKEQEFNQLLRDALPIMKKLFSFRERPQLAIPNHDSLGNLGEDPNRGYSRKLTHMFSWEIEDLADLCKNQILSTRQTIWRPPSNVAAQNDGGLNVLGKKSRTPPPNTIINIDYYLSWNG